MTECVRDKDYDTIIKVLNKDTIKSIIEDEPQSIYNASKYKIKDDTKYGSPQTFFEVS